MAKFLSGIKKLAVMLIAGLMILGVVPIGLVSKPETVSAEGEFLRLSPAEEAFVSAVPGETDKSGRELFSGVNLAGSQNDTYMRFDLSGLADVMAKDIRSAVLRLAVVYTGAETSDTAELKLMQDAHWNSGITYMNRPSDTNEEKLADFQMDGFRKTGSVIEVELTDRVKEYLKNKNYEIDFHIDSQNGGLAAVFASARYEDKAFRPCLKIVTGDAQDTDQADLTKAWLAGVNASYDGDAIRTDDGNAAYLRFCLNRDNIQGAMYDIRLKGYIKAADAGSVISVSVVDCGERSITDSLDDCSVSLAGSVDAAEGAWGVTLTNEINDIFNNGGETVTLKISTNGGSVLLGGDESAPELDIRATDSSKIVAVTEAGSAAIGENTDKSAIKENLSRDYTAADGTKAFFKWSAFDNETGERVNGLISGDGSITRPKWYDDSRTVRAKAIISSGAYRIERNYVLTVLPAEKPDFSAMEVSDYTDVGSAESEKATGAEAVNADAHSRWIDGSFLTYRTLQDDGFVIVNQIVDPDNLNYITFKLNGAELPSSELVITDADTGAELQSLSIRSDMSAAEDGFVYVTYPLPLECTLGKGVISLRLAASETVNDGIPWNIYGTYTGTDAYFDPLAYTSQGEVFVNKKPAEDTAFYGFIMQLYKTTKQIMPVFGDNDTEKTEESAPNYAWADSSGVSALVFGSGSDNVAVTLKNGDAFAKIQRSNLYYGAISEVPVSTDGGIVNIGYGNFRIIRNKSENSIRLPEEFSGIYKNLADGKFYSFINDGELADDSVLPMNSELDNGKDLELAPGETAIMELAAKPLQCADWRVGRINGKSITDLSINREESVNEISVKNVGAAGGGAEMKIICCVYERGMLCGMSSQCFETRPGCAEYTVSIKPVELKPGRTLKVFVEAADSVPEGMQPKLELP